jgi:hypothetical protein
MFIVSSAFLMDGSLAVVRFVVERPPEATVVGGSALDRKHLVYAGNERAAVAGPQYATVMRSNSAT